MKPQAAEIHMISKHHKAPSHKNSFLAPYFILISTFPSSLLKIQYQAQHPNLSTNPPKHFHYQISLQTLQGFPSKRHPNKTILGDMHTYAMRLPVRGAIK
ncbi:hypothetical protein EYC80_004113 [Monilinia laxa]|uniref:Uncharacterized protein n=1 Tax=Monilinia laxa TaxID=61186 RepID=A0A5N6KLT7_MONLA|nr:hypothetical protein EYC80_004113 [Monilinia laxa]